MQNTERIAELLQPVFKNNDVKLYEIVWLANEHTLQIAITKQNNSIDLDTCAIVSEQISEVLDEYDPISEEYTLEVCSPGAEREIKDLDELENLVGSYVYAELKEPFKNMYEFTGEILSVEDGLVKLSYRDKAAKRTAQFTKENIQFIRMAVKF